MDNIYNFNVKIINKCLKCNNEKKWLHKIEMLKINLKKSNIVNNNNNTTYHNTDSDWFTKLEDCKKNSNNLNYGNEQ